MVKTRVLFLCTGNSARSQIAEVLLRKYADRYFEVYSAGLKPREIHPYTYVVMREIGLNLDEHYSKPLDHFVGLMHFGYLITVCDRAEENCPIFPGMGQRLYWPFEDPVAFQGTVTEYRADHWFEGNIEDSYTISSSTPYLDRMKAQAAICPNSEGFL